MVGSVESQGSDRISNLAGIMEKQNKIAEALVKQQNLFSLPPFTMPVFKGDPLEYQFFMRAFEHGIEEQTVKTDFTFWSSLQKVSQESWCAAANTWNQAEDMRKQTGY